MVRVFPPTMAVITDPMQRPGLASYSTPAWSDAFNSNDPMTSIPPSTPFDRWGKLKLQQFTPHAWDYRAGIVTWSVQHILGLLATPTGHRQEGTGATH